MTDFAPVALFVYRRTGLLDRVLDALEACPEFPHSDIYIFSDGPKSEASAPDVEAVRALVRSRIKPNMKLVEAAENKGLARSIIEGVTRLCNDYGQAIVLEDDLIVSPAILTWFNSALKRYNAQGRVMQVSGHMFDVPQLRAAREGIFLPMTTSWGWATWRRAWEMFDAEANGWEQIVVNRPMRHRFDLNGAYPYARMLQRQMRGEVDSWAIRWYWSVFVAGGLTLFPPQSMVQNLGTDSQATHKSKRNRLRPPSEGAPLLSAGDIALPADVLVDVRAYNCVRLAIRKSRTLGLAGLQEKIGGLPFFRYFLKQ